MNIRSYSFSEMAVKQVINVADGRALGRVCDMVFDARGCVLGFVVPGRRGFIRSVTTSDNIFIPWRNIIKIGSDVMLVELIGSNAYACTLEKNGAAEDEDEAEK
jgi:YlmC/YmxH family sporulation protein